VQLLLQQVLEAVVFSQAVQEVTGHMEAVEVAAVLQRSQIMEPH
jgi:hypothetical protein